MASPRIPLALSIVPAGARRASPPHALNRHRPYPHHRVRHGHAATLRGQVPHVRARTQRWLPNYSHWLALAVLVSAPPWSRRYHVMTRAWRLHACRGPRPGLCPCLAKGLAVLPPNTTGASPCTAAGERRTNTGLPLEPVGPLFDRHCKSTLDITPRLGITFESFWFLPKPSGSIDRIKCQSLV